MPHPDDARLVCAHGAPDHSTRHWARTPQGTVTWLNEAAQQRRTERSPEAAAGRRNQLIEMAGRVAPAPTAEGEAAAVAAGPEFEARVLAVLDEIERKSPEFTTDMVWEELARQGVDTSHRAAMGVIMRRAARARGYVRTGYTRSQRPGSHARAGLTVWTAPGGTHGDRDT